MKCLHQRIHDLYEEIGNRRIVAEGLKTDYPKEFTALQEEIHNLHFRLMKLHERVIYTESLN